MESFSSSRESLLAANVSSAKRLPTGCAFRGQQSQELGGAKEGIRSFRALTSSRESLLAANVMDIRSLAALKKASGAFAR
jgi:hypothetical protein